MGVIGLLIAHYGDLEGILSGLTKSTDHPSMQSRVLVLRMRNGFRPQTRAYHYFEPYLEARGSYNQTRTVLITQL